jgi:predicted O-linked N-acetylglucosamine transferase (SPINDLY family)
MVENWRDITDLDDAGAYDLIVRDGVTLLVDLAGHTAWNRLPLMALRPAPIQLTWIGYPHSTGLAQIDYRITDAVADPPGISESLHSEQPARLPGCFLCYTPPADAPQPSAFPPVQNVGVLTFGCFNNLAKIPPTLLDCWKKLLEQVPQSRLLIKGEAFDDPAAQSELLKRFGLPDNRVLTCGWTPDRISHLALYNQVDIALDTWPYNGTTTTCEALWMGVPVVTLAGEHHASRVGASLLTAVGLEYCVCKSAEEYVQRAAELAGNLHLLQALRSNLRTMLYASPLMDGPGFTQKLEKLYGEIVSANSAR